MSDEKILAMPIERFWLYSESIDRMKSADDIRAIKVAAAVLSSEAHSSTMDSLNESVGMVAHREFEKDTQGIEKLKQLMI
jgi:hypothetical protein